MYKDYHKQITPEFGEMLIDKITTLQIVEFMADLKPKKGKELETNTKLNIYKVFKSILERAHGWGVINSNPIEGVKRPSTSKKEKKAMRFVKQNYSWVEVEVLYDRFLYVAHKLAVVFSRHAVMRLSARRVFSR